MPFKSDAQRKYMNYAANKGLIKPGVVNEFNQASKGLKLPKFATVKLRKFLKPPKLKF